MPFRSVDPANGEEVASVPGHSPAEVERRLRRAERAFGAWRERSFAQRAAVLERAAKLLLREKDEHARTMAREMGKTLASAVAEAEKCALACRHYARHGAAYLADEPVRTQARRSFVRYEPLGPVLAVMPWNFPYWQVFRFAAPALMAGNCALLKHASNVPLCARAIESLLRRAGLPEGVFQNLFVDGDRVARVIADLRVRAVTLTGSERGGAAVAAAAGQHVKKVVLELGGSDPFIVLPSADLDAAVETAVKSRMINNGQSCIAAKRFVVHAKMYRRFEEAFVARVRALRVGDPMDEATELGPLVSEEALRHLHAQVRRSVRAGAALLTGGARLRRRGWFYAPTVLARVPASSPAAREELFGPVASLFRASDAGDALRIANDTPFGLAASVWTRDTAERDRFVRGIDAGVVFVNGMVASDPRLPFGGVKRSGHGRELGAHGIREFVNAKTVCVEAAR